MTQVSDVEHNDYQVIIEENVGTQFIVSTCLRGGHNKLCPYKTLIFKIITTSSS